MFYYACSLMPLNGRLNFTQVIVDNASLRMWAYNWLLTHA